MSQTRIITETDILPIHEEITHHLKEENYRHAQEVLEEEMNNFIEILPSEDQDSWHKYFKPLADKMDGLWAEGKKFSQQSWESMLVAVTDFMENVTPLAKRLNYTAKESWQKIEKGLKSIENYCQEKAQKVNEKFHEPKEQLHTWGKKIETKAKNIINEIAK